MSREDFVFNLLVDSNPIPDIDVVGRPKAAAPGLATLEPRSSGMSDTIEKIGSVGKERRRWLLTAAAVVIAVIGIAVIAANRDRGTEPADGPNLTAEEVAGTFVGAAEALDGAVIEGLISPEATAGYLDLFGYGSAQPGTIQGLWEWGAIYHMTYVSEGCRKSDNAGGPPSSDQATSSSVFFTCDYTLENDWTRALGQTAMTGRFRMEVSEGRIVWLTEDFPFGEFEDAWGKVIDWVQNNHPDDFATMFLDGPPGAGLAESAQLTPESMALWERYNPEIVQSLAG